MGQLPAYCNVQDVTSALDSTPSAALDRQVARIIGEAARGIDDATHRVFYPITDTRYFNWPTLNHRARSWVLWLDKDEVVSVATLTVAGKVLDPATYFLEPVNWGPPFDRVELNLADSAGFGFDQTHQRAIQVDGVFGWSVDTDPAGELAGDVTAAATTCTVTDSTALGVGDALLIGSEYVIVTGRGMADTGATITAGLTAASSTDDAVTVSAGTFSPGEVLLVGSERVKVRDVAGSTLVVERAVDGTTLAAHTTGDTLYASRLLTVSRGALGSTAAAHTTGDAVARHRPPPMVRQLNIAEAIDTLQQEESAYARVVGTGETAIQVRGQGLENLRRRVFDRYERRVRTAAI